MTNYKNPKKQKVEKPSLSKTINSDFCLRKLTDLQISNHKQKGKKKKKKHNSRKTTL